MRQTLFFIPDELAGYPLFGFGWLLALWLIGSAVVFAYYVRKQGWTADTLGLLPFVGIVSAAIAFVLPIVKVDVMAHEARFLLWESAPNPATGILQGLPIRGYGIFLLIAVVSGLALATYRAKRVGLSPDAIFGLAFHMFVGGIVGARLFFVIQKWDGIYDPQSLANTIGNMLNFVEGGLVVYGSFIGALVTGLWFLRKHGLPVLAVADLISPSLALGLAIGRFGCLMNGCCFGGVCYEPWAVTFPQNSPPYLDQHRHGEFYGFRIAADENGKPNVARVDPGSEAEKIGLTTGMAIDRINDVSVATMEDVQRELSGCTSHSKLFLTSGQEQFTYSILRLPDAALPTHPTQIYSSINAALLSLLTLSWFPFRRRDGEVFALLVASYAVTRFLLEIIRTDEVGIWSTGMTISQLVSVGMLIAVAALVAYLWNQPRGTFWPEAAAS